VVHRRVGRRVTELQLQKCKDNTRFVVHDDLELENANEATDDEFRMIVKKFI
ncbi:4139_t:CDS:1, partial [Gigaspora rosea]